MAAKTPKSNATAAKPKAKKTQVEPAQAAAPPIVEPPKPRRKINKKKLLLTLLALAVVLAPTVFFYAKYQDSQEKLKNPEAITKRENKELVEKISKHAVLPTNEEPTVATVSDVSKLNKQSFFISAKNGDKVLVYAKSKKAVLYRPSLDRVVNISPVTQ